MHFPSPADISALKSPCDITRNMVRDNGFHFVSACFPLLLLKLRRWTSVCHRGCFAAFGNLRSLVCTHASRKKALCRGCLLLWDLSPVSWPSPKDTLWSSRATELVIFSTAAKGEGNLCDNAGQLGPVLWEGLCCNHGEGNTACFRIWHFTPQVLQLFQCELIQMFPWELHLW